MDAFDRQRAVGLETLFVGDAQDPVSSALSLVAGEDIPSCYRILEEGREMRSSGGRTGPSWKTACALMLRQGWGGCLHYLPVLTRQRDSIEWSDV
jgi:hypothetical protein